MPEHKAVFDAVAESYDSSFTFSGTGSLQRKRVHHFLDRLLPENWPLQVLEINCGTGADAVYLSGKGHQVVATDASPAMIAQALKKFPQHNVAFSICSIQNLDKEFAGRQFDLIFSDFGGLNCLSPDEFKNAVGIFHSLLRENGRCIFVLMGRKCLWEIFYFLFKTDIRNAFRRLKKTGVDAQVGATFQKTFYYSPRELLRMMSPCFESLQRWPVGIALPPSYLESFFKNKKLLLQVLNWKERWISFSGFSNFGDHYLAVFRKMPGVFHEH